MQEPQRGRVFQFLVPVQPFPHSEATADIANGPSQVFDIGLGSSSESFSAALQPVTINRSEWASKAKSS